MRARLSRWGVIQANLWVSLSECFRFVGKKTKKKTNNQLLRPLLNALLTTLHPSPALCLWAKVLAVLQGLWSEDNPDMLWVDWHPLGHHCSTDEEIIVYIWIEDRKFSDSDSLQHWQIARNTLIFSCAFSSCFFLLLSLSLSLSLPCPNVFVTPSSSLWLCLPDVISLPLLSSYAVRFPLNFPCGLFPVARSLFFFSGSHCTCCFSGFSHLLHAMAACTFSPRAPSLSSPKYPASHSPADAMCCLGGPGVQHRVSPRAAPSTSASPVAARSPGPRTQLRGHVCCSPVTQPPCCHPSGPKPSRYPLSLTPLHHACSR